MHERFVSSSFIGRREELGRLVDALDRVPVGVLVSGDAGVGKTRLLREFAMFAADRGARLLSGSCAALAGEQLPYGPFVEALREVAHDVLLPGSAPAVGDPARARVMDEMLRLVERLGEATPLVLVIEDLHWADPATIELLGFLLRNLRRVPTLLMGTYRGDEPLGYPLRALLAELDRGRRCVRVDLAPFDRAEIHALLGDILGEPPLADLTERILRRSEGNPFYAEELLAVEREVPGAPLPPRLRDVLMVRVEVLPDPAKAVLAVLAASGGPVPHRLLERVTRLPPERLLPAVRDLVTHRIAVVDHNRSAYHFRHQLAREAVYADLLPGERAAMHEAIAQALETTQEPAGTSAAITSAELAYHWLAADRPGPALRTAVAAGREAADGCAYEDAHRQFERALELWARVPRPAAAAGLSHEELLARAAEAASLSGDLDRALAVTQRALDETSRAGDLVRTGALWDRLGRYRWAKGDTAGAVAAFAEAIRLLDERSDPALRARFLASQAAMLMVLGQFRESRDRCESALGFARISSARAEEGFALTTLGVDLAMIDDVEAGIRCLTTACGVVQEAGTLEDIARAHANLSYVYEVAGRLEDAVAAARRGIELTSRFGVERTILGGVLLTNAASQLLQLGRWDEASDCLHDAVGFDGADGLLGAYGFLYRAELRIGRGQWDEAADDLTRAEAIAQDRTLDEPTFIGPLHGCRAELALWHGAYNEGNAAVTCGLAAIDRSEDLQAGLQLCAIGLRSTADEQERRRSLRSPDSALTTAGGQLLDHARELADRTSQWTSPLPQAQVLIALCEAEFLRLQDGSDPKHWARVAQKWEELRRPYACAYARFREGEALLRRRRPDSAAAPVRAAWRTAQGLSAQPLCRELTALARRGRIDLTEADVEVPEPPAPASQLGLTPRERQVLVHLVEGRTNRQIARALFIAEKTASVHVSNILAKLGAENRSEAAAIAHRLHLV